MKTSQAIKEMAILDALPSTTKHDIFNEMLNLGLRISYGQTTWHKHIRQSTKTTKGDLKRFYSALTNFSPQDVDVFLSAFSEH